VTARTLEELMDAAALESRDVVFHAPWEARAFAIALSLCRSGSYAWEDFRRLLIAEISAAERAHSPDDYYQQFVRALEKLLAEKQIVDAGEVASRIEQLRIAQLKTA
jgi:nitrile hydratase accessory protein